MRKKILKDKAEGVIKKEAGESNFHEEDREKALEEIHEAIEKGEIKRFQDLKNKAKEVLKDIADEKDIDYYE